MSEGLWPHSGKEPVKACLRIHNAAQTSRLINFWLGGFQFSYEIKKLQEELSAC